MGQGPLSGVKIVEFAGIGPTPFCGMLLSDLGADVVRIDRPGPAQPGRPQPGHAADIVSRGRRSIALDLKAGADRALALALLERADGLIEGFRPGVMERNGLGPDRVLARNRKLVYGRMTGWGQTGPLAGAAGHDLNYVAISGALHAMGDGHGRPRPPLNLVGDYGGGALYLVFGLLAGILHVRNGGEGQVVDCAMSDGAASLMTLFYGLRAGGLWSDRRDANLLDGGAPFYDTYACRDGEWVAVAAIEPQFYAQLLDRAGIDDPALANPVDRSKWPALKQKLAAIFKTRDRDEWCALMEGSDACLAPVLSMAAAPHHRHNAARGTFVTLDGVVQPAPAPRFSQTPGAVQGGSPGIDANRDDILADWGVV